MDNPSPTVKRKKKDEESSPRTEAVAAAGAEDKMEHEPQQQRRPQHQHHPMVWLRLPQTRKGQRSRWTMNDALREVLAKYNTESGCFDADTVIELPGCCYGECEDCGWSPLV
mmetsp:Transcript_12087/g.29148  ORF Transcript_12087/g.29148 Transcript_12087/m.29148 type:complete len:112 (+) Transcript_12087:101-436(+)